MPRPETDRAARRRATPLPPARASRETGPSARGRFSERSRPSERPPVSRTKGRRSKTITHVLKQIFGAPDYAAYLDHCTRAGHPPRLDEKQYVAEFFAAKGKRMRCC
jgi:uncharacterized short protein YbdD (DUF466 family)